jgi:hypothetical protein
MTSKINTTITSENEHLFNIGEGWNPAWGRPCCKHHAPSAWVKQEIKSWSMNTLFALIGRVENALHRPEDMDARIEARNTRLYMVDILKPARRGSTIGDVWGMMSNEAIDLAVSGYRMGQECEGMYDDSLPCAKQG